MAAVCTSSLGTQEQLQGSLSPVGAIAMKPRSQKQSRILDTLMDSHLKKDNTTCPQSEASQLVPSSLP